MNFTFITLDFAGEKKNQPECRLFQTSCPMERNATPNLPIGKLSGKR